MHKPLKAQLTNMCFIEDDKGRILFQKRVKNDRPGYTLPGGHVEKGETLTDSVKREIKEETGLTIFNPRLVGLMEFKTIDDEDIYLVFIYKTNKFEGKLIDSSEGHLIFAKEEDIKEEDFALDMKEIISMCKEGKFTDIVYRKNEKGDYYLSLE